MTDKDKKWLQAGGERKVCVACGGRSYVNIGNIAGYCHNFLHTGYVTQNVLSGHGCIGKECRYFERFEEFPLWANREEKEEKKAEEKARRKQKEAEKQNKKAALLEKYRQTAIEVAAKYHYPITIVAVRERGTDGKEVYVFFISESERNDTRLYNNIAVDLRWKYPKVKFIVRRIMRSDGTCATAKDFPNPEE
jgi:hypothetical protein